MYFRVALIVVSLIVGIQAQGQKPTRSKPLSERQKKAQLDLLKAVEEYKQSLESLLVLQEADVQRATETLENRRELLTESKISKKEVEQSERALDSAKAQVKTTKRQIAEADLLGKTAINQPQLVRIKTPYPKNTLLRVLKLNALPLSEIQTAIENRGVNFHLTPEDELEFYGVGATRELLKTIASNYRSQ